MPRMTRIPSDLHAWGLPTFVVDGAGSRGSSSFAPRAVVDHWTATPYKPGRVLPTRNVLINGHGDLPGPLCNVALAFDGGCHVVAMGRANHAGKGGWAGAVGNSGAYGIEAEGTGKWTPEQRYIYPILVAALLHGLSRDAGDNCGHSEWAGPRKIDINGWPDGGMTGFRRRVAALLAAGPKASPLHHYGSLAAAIKAQGPDPKPVTGKAPTAPPAATVHAPGSRTLQYVPGGVLEGDDVLAVQRWAGFTGADLDRRYGPKTRDAVKRVQGVVKVPQTGVVDKTTWSHYAAWVAWQAKKKAEAEDAVRDTAAAKEAARRAARNRGVVAKVPAGSAWDKRTGSLSQAANSGKKHGGVTKLQTQLKARGYYLGRVDGKYGPATTSSVRAFQRDIGVAPTGITGQYVWDSAWTRKV